MIYNMMITEYLRKSVRVEAESAGEAYEKVCDLLSQEKIILSADDFTDRDIDTLDDYEYNHSHYGTQLTHSKEVDVDIDFTDYVFVKDSEGYACKKLRQDICEGDCIISEKEYYNYIGQGKESDND